MPVWGVGPSSGAWGASGWGRFSPAGRRNDSTEALAPGKVVSSQAATRGSILDAARSLLRTVGASFSAAVTSFTSSVTPVINRATTSGSTSTASVGGLALRLTPANGDSSTLQSTLQINTQTSTVRSSMSALGLDLSGPAASSLASNALGLDLTSADSASVLSSSMAMGLDVTSAEAASRLSSNALGLDVTSAERASTRQSTAEINTATTSLSAYELSFTGSSSKAQLAGAYIGTATSLKITTTGATALGSSAAPLAFQVTDQNNVEVFSYTGTATADQVIDLGATGLKVRFTAGTLALGNATTNVSQTPTTVNTAAAFNAAFASAPRFENYQQVTAGSFSINGTSIAVNANDSINSVIARINSSAAGVTAAVSGDTLTLTSNGISEEAITLGTDTSGFLAATKLAASTTTLGNVRDDQQVLAKTSQFAGVASGSFTVNGVTITVDRNTDSLSSVISRINSAGAGVTASYDTQQDRLVLTTTGNSEELVTVSNDTTGLLSTAGLSTGNTVRGNIRDDQQVLSKMAQFSGVSSGSFTVNGVSIAVNTATDTVESLVARINGAGAGVTAAYDADADALRLTSTTDGLELIEIGNDSTGFLAAAHLDSANTVRGHVAEDTAAFRDLSAFQSVTDGSFVVDGRTIAVTRDDSVQSIVIKINQSGARVTAAFDTGSGAIQLTTTYGTEDDIAIGGDTSGFLAAAGIDAANTVAGNIADDQQVLAKTTQFGGVSSGSFDVNGVTIAVDADVDSLDTIIDRINAAGAGVTASYDTGTDRLVFTPDSDGATLVLGNDSSGVLAAAHVAEGARGTAVNPNAAFNGTGASDPMFDPGAAVGAGSFTVNGTVITVAADDSITSVLARISASEAGVTASYDAATQTIALTSTTMSSDPIVLADDTSGFLSAVKLDGATVSTTGASAIDPYASAFDQIAEYAGVTAGTLTVNGQSLVIDPATTSLRDLVTALDELDGVSATLDEATGAVRVSADAAGGDLELADTSGLLGALGIATGTHAGVVGQSMTVEQLAGYTKSTNTSAVAAGVSAAVDTLVTAVGELAGARSGSAGFRGEINGALSDVVDSLRHAGVQGLSVTDADGAVTLSVDQAALEASLEGLGDRVRAARAIEDLVEGFAGRVADIAAREDGGSRLISHATKDTRPVREQLADQVRAQLAVTQIERPHHTARSGAARKARANDVDARRKTRAADDDRRADRIRPREKEDGALTPLLASWLDDTNKPAPARLDSVAAQPGRIRSGRPSS